MDVFGSSNSTNFKKIQPKTMNPKSWSTREWVNFFSAIPAFISVIVFIPCALFSVLTMVVVGGWFLPAVALTAIFFSSVVIFGMAARNRIGR